MRLDSISIKPHGRGKRCLVRLLAGSGNFDFTDLVEFSTGVAELLRHTEGLHAPHALHPDDRQFLQIESVYVEDAGEHNKRTIPAREVKGRRELGQKVAGGAWYMELTVNGAANDCSFTSTLELFQCLQTIIRREMQHHGQIATSLGETAHA